MSQRKKFEKKKARENEVKKKLEKKREINQRTKKLEQEVFKIEKQLKKFQKDQPSDIWNTDESDTSSKGN